MKLESLRKVWGGVSPKKWLVYGGLCFVVGGTASVAANVMAGESSDAALVKKVQVAFPNTKVGSVTCGVVPGLCEVTAGKNVFYVTPDARYAMVGAVLDLKNRVDLTDRRQKELGELDAVTSRLGGGAVAAEPASAPASQQAAPTLGPIKIDLPIGNAIVHHPGAPLKVSVMTDLNCGYCKMLMESIKSAPDIELTEYPMQLLREDSGDKAKLALCAKDREASANNIYEGGPVSVTGDCAKAAAAVQQNTAFARAHGISGTPALIRADGQTHPGFMPVDQLREWIKGAQG